MQSLLVVLDTSLQPDYLEVEEVQGRAIVQPEHHLLDSREEQEPEVAGQEETAGTTTP